jgi:hypothetical protein
MSALVPRPAEATTPRLTKADVPRYVNAILAVYAVVDSLGIDDYAHAPLRALATCLEQRMNDAGLSAEAACVAGRMRGETSAVAPVVELRPHLVAQEEAAR